MLLAKEEEAKHFIYQAGQFITFFIPHNEGEIQRVYSLTSAPCIDINMTICVKRVKNGRGSNWFHDQLTAGSTILAKPPTGNFTLKKNTNSVFFIAGGSGITPCISIIKQALYDSERSIKLLYASQNKSAIIYEQQLASLTKQFSDRFHCEHWLNNNKGYLTAEQIKYQTTGYANANFFICGPAPLMKLAEHTLVNLFGENVSINIERFISLDTPQQTITNPVATNINISSEYQVRLDNREYTVPISPKQTLLEAALQHKIKLPHLCKEGHCGTCIALLKQGKVSMTSTKALSKRNIKQGKILACQAYPSTSEPIILDFDI